MILFQIKHRFGWKIISSIFAPFLLQNKKKKPTKPHNISLIFYKMSKLVDEINPYFFASVGIGLCIGVSVIGAAWLVLAFFLLLFIKFKKLK